MKLGIIGGWGHFVHVLDETEAMPEAEVVGLAKGTPDEDFASIRTRYPPTNSAPEYPVPRTLLADAQPSVAVISTRIDRIADFAVEAAEAGCHLICEKPLAIGHEPLRRLWDAMKANAVQCYAMLAGRAHPVLAAARKAIDDGLIGDLQLLNARKSYKFGTTRPRWSGDHNLYGGTIPWIGIHAFDIVDAVTDSPAEFVSALHANTSHPGWPDCEDAA